MASEASTLGLSVKPSGFAETNNVLELFKKRADDAGQAADKLSDKSDKAGDKARKVGQDARAGSQGIETLGAKATKVTGTMHRLAAVTGSLGGALVAAFSLRGMAQAADKWSDMQSQVGAAIKDMSAAPAVMQRMVELANATYSPLEQTVTAFASNIGALRDMGLGAEAAADYTEALNHALVITATKGEKAASVQNALSRAMDLGKLSGDGLETVLANGGRVAEALAKELGTNVSSLRSFSSQGKITSAVIANALTKELGNLRKEAGEMPATMADGMTRLTTNITAFIGQMDKALGVSSLIASGIFLVADNIDILAGAFAGIAAGVMAAYIPSLIAATVAMSKLVAGMVMGTLAANNFRIALARTGIGLIVVAVGAVATAMMKLVLATGSVSAAWYHFKEVAGATWDYVKSSAQAIPAALLSVWYKVKSDFFYMLADINQAWANTLRGFGLDGVALDIEQGPMTQQTKAGTDALEDAGRQKDIAAGLRAEGLDRMAKALAGVKAASDEAKKALGDSNDTKGGGGVTGALNKAGGAAKKAADDTDKYTEVMKALRQELELLQATQGMSELDKAIYGKQQEANVKPGTVAGIALADVMKTIDGLKRVEEAGKRGAEAVSGIFTSMLDGTKSLKQGVAELLMEMAKVQMQNAIMKASGLGGGGGGGIFGFIGSLLTPWGGGKATGGPVSAGTSYLVGERGPEIVTMGANGYVAPNNHTAKALQAQPAQEAGGNITIGFDQTTGSLTAYFKNVAGEVVSQASTKIIAGAVKSVRAETKRGN